MQRYQNNFSKAQGNSLRPVAGASVLVTTIGGAVATIYSDNGVTATTNPLTTDANGMFAFYAADGRYSLTITSSETATVVVSDILLEDPQDGSPMVINGGTISNSALSNVTIDGVAVAGSDIAKYSRLDDPDGSSIIGFIQSGTGAILNTVQDEQRPVVRPQQFMTSAQRADVAAGAALLDVTEAIRAAHTHANLNGLPVSYQGVVKAAIQSDAQIVINTDVDFCGCDFQILNGIEPETIDFTYRRLFIVQDASISARVISLTAAELFDGAYDFTVPNDLGQGLLVVGSNKQINGRQQHTTNYGTYEQVFKINRLGVTDFPLNTDLTASTTTATFYRSPNRRVTLRNLAADMDKYNNQTLVEVRRNLVDIDGFTVLPRTTDVGVRNVNALLSFVNCCDVTVRNVASTGQPSIERPGGGFDGTYVFSLSYVANIRFENVAAETGWGAFGANHVSGLYVNNSTVNRVEAHAGAFNIFVDNCVMTAEGVKYGWGGGTIALTNSVINDGVPLAYRGDYGGSFNGDLFVQNVTFNSTENTGDGITTFNFEEVIQILNVGGNLPITVAKNITCKGLRVNTLGASGALILRPVIITLSGSGAITAPLSITVDDVACSKLASIVVNPVLGGMVANTKDLTTVRISNCDSQQPKNDSCPLLIDLTTVPAQTSPTPVKAKVFIDKCTNVAGYFTLKSAEVLITNSSLCAFKNFSGGFPNQRLTLRNVSVENTVSVGGETQGSIGSITTAVNIATDVNFRANGLIGTMNAVQGITIETGVTVTLPGGITAATAFTGWKEASKFV